MSKLDEALKRFEQVATNGFRGSDYIQVDDSRAWFREDLAVVKKSVELLGLYQTYHYEPSEINQRIKTLEKELGETK